MDTGFRSAVRAGLLHRENRFILLHLSNKPSTELNYMTFSMCNDIKITTKIFGSVNPLKHKSYNNGC